jgi:S1-C subfamily serine protease
VTAVAVQPERVERDSDNQVVETPTKGEVPDTPISDVPQPMDRDGELLDAYSRAVIGVVDRAGPAVVSLEVMGKRGPSGAGSGFVVTPDGYIMTNSHVVHGAREIKVRTPAGEIAKGQVMGDDPATDLALVRIDPAPPPMVPGPVYLPADELPHRASASSRVAIGNRSGRVDGVDRRRVGARAACAGDPTA